MNKKRLLYSIISILSVLVILFMSCGLIYQLREKADEADTGNPEDHPDDCPAYMYWDGICYEKLGHVDEEDIKLPKLGEITEIVDISGLPEKNGQSNSPIMPIGAEIYSLLHGRNLAMYADGEWWLLKPRREWGEY